MSSQNQISVFLFFLSFNESVVSNAKTVRTSNDTSSLSSTEPLVIEILSALFNMTVPRTQQYQPTTNHSHLLQRVKRQQQQGESKYSQASKMGETKIIQLLAQMLANPFATEYIGGAHPFHPEVPKSIVILFKQKIMGFLFPRIGDRW